MSATTARWPSTVARGLRLAGSRGALDFLVAIGLGLAVPLTFGGHAFLNYDSAYALAWGADLADGSLPRYDVPVAPTPHPLAIAVAWRWLRWGRTPRASSSRSS